MDENYKKCSYCDEEFNEYKWCKECDPYRIIEGWTSGEVSIDRFIKDTMYEARNGEKWLEWISFDRFIDKVSYEDGPDKVDLAGWLGSKNEPRPVKVFLKYFNLSDEWLNEV